nr:hypothetical protein [uncultured bacterium]
MKFSKLILACLFVFFSTNTNAQRIKLIEGSLEGLKKDTSFNFEFSYEKMVVGRYDNEADYIKDKTAKMNEKIPGNGDKWAKRWISSRTEDYEPKFIELFSAFTGTNTTTNSRYTIIIHTTTTEPGYDVVGGLTFGASKSATINAEITIVETANRSKKIAVLTIEKAAGAPGATFSGTTTGEGNLRITEAYGSAGRDIAKFMKKYWK